MADFKIAIAKVLQNEGGYANDRDDNGGETYMGISRKFWSNCEIWPIIDSAKCLSTFPAVLKVHTYLQSLVLDFYRENFWNLIGGDQINDQAITDLLIDSAVNEGIVPAIKRAQAIVNIDQTGHINSELISKLNSLA
jgi:lysozyme family protein